MDYGHHIIWPNFVHAPKKPWKVLNLYLKFIHRIWHFFIPHQMSKCVLQFTLRYVFTPYNKTYISKRVMYLIISTKTKGQFWWGFCSKNQVTKTILKIEISTPLTCFFFLTHLTFFLHLLLGIMRKMKKKFLPMLNVAPHLNCYLTYMLPINLARKLSCFSRRTHFTSHVFNFWQLWLDIQWTCKTPQKWKKERSSRPCYHHVKLLPLYTLSLG